MEKKFKTLIIILACVAVVLLGVLAWVWFDRKGMIKELNIEKQELTEQMVQLRFAYDSLSTNNDSINAQLLIEQERIDILIEKVKKTEATNRIKIRAYEKELGTLRSIMRSYIQQIDSLNTLNIALRKDAASARKEAESKTMAYEELRTTTEEYARKIAMGEQLKARNFSMTGIMSNAKESNRSSRIIKLKVCFNIIENSIAQRGPRRLYLRIKGPDDILLTNEQQGIFTVNGEQYLYTSTREIDYQGQEVEVCIFFNGNNFCPGVYTAQAYSEDGPLGSIDLLLR